MGAGSKHAWLMVTVAVVAVLLAVPSPAMAGFPGVNGQDRFTSDRDGNPRDLFDEPRRVWSRRTSRPIRRWITRRRGTGPVEDRLHQ